MDTDGRRVEAIPHEQEKQTAPNMDNVDNRTQTHRPRVYISTPKTAVFYVETDVFAAETAVF